MNKKEDILDKIEENYPGFSKISLNHKEIFDSFFDKCEYQISEYTFSNLFMWKTAYNFLWNEIEGNLILMTLEDLPLIKIFPPIGKNPINSIKAIQDFSIKNELKVEMIRVPEKLKKKIMEAGLQIEFEEDRNNWDYLYKKSDLVELPGKEYQNIRKKVNKFKRKYDWKFELISEKNIDECKNMHEEWCEERKCEDDSSLIHEKHGVFDIFNHWKEFDIIGGLLRSQGKIVAFSLYEEACNEMLVCHVEKANTSFEGVYNAINQITLENIQKDYKYVNREQDLGKEGLRISKTRYHPIDFVKKYKIEIN